MIRLILMYRKGIILLTAYCILPTILSARGQVYPDSAERVALTHCWNATGETGGNRVTVRDSKGYIHLVFNVYGIWMRDSAEVYHTFSTDNGLTWSRPENVSRTDTLPSVEPCLVVDSKDILHCVWKQHQYDSLNGIWSWDLYYSYRDQDGWSDPINVSRQYQRSNDSYYPSLVIDSRDHLHLVWDYYADPTSWDIYYSCYNGTTWTDPYQLCNFPYDDAFPAIAIDPGDVLHVVWRQRAGGGPVYYCYKDSSGWSTPEVAAAPGGTGSAYPTVVADSKGRPHVVFTNWATGFGDIYYTYRDTSGWTPVENVSQSSIGSGYPALAVDSLGQLYLVWSENHDIYYSTRKDTVWSEPVNLTEDPAYSYCPNLGNPVSSQGVDLVWCSYLYEPPETYEIMYMKLTPIGVEEERASALRNPDLIATPNPFTHRVRIEYNLSSAADIRFKILDVSGRIVEQFEPGVQPAGRHCFTWQVTNLPAGIYFLLFEIEGRTQSLRLVKIK